MKSTICLYVVSVLLLAGCSDQAEPADKIESVHAVATKHSSEIPAYYEDYILNPQVTDDRSLLEEGQTSRDNKGEVTLKAVNTDDSQTYEIGPIEMTVREAKVFHFKPDYSLIDFFHSYTHEPEFHVAKLFVEIKNTSDKPLKFAPVSLLNTSADEMKLWEDDIYLEELNGEMAAGETKKGNLGFIIENPEIDSLTITTSDVFEEGEKKIQNAKEIELQF